GAGQRELGRGVGDRGGIERVAGRGRKEDVEVVDVRRRDGVDGEVRRVDRAGEVVRRAVREAVAALDERDRDRAARVGAGCPVAEDGGVPGGGDKDGRLRQVDRPAGGTGAGEGELGGEIGDRGRVDRLRARGERDVDVALLVEGVRPGEVDRDVRG